MMVQSRLMQSTIEQLTPTISASIQQTKNYLGASKLVRLREASTGETTF